MRFAERLVEGRLVRRYQRFLADVELDDGTVVTAHCANPGSMLGCRREGARVVLSHQEGPGRKLAWTWELVRVGRHWVGINTARTNHVVAEALEQHQIPELAGYRSVRREVKFGAHSRVDFMLEYPEGPCPLEVKNVTLAHRGRARFPDSVTARGRRHLEELAGWVARGRRAVVFFLVNRADCTRMEPARDIDPAFSESLRSAAAKGVQVIARSARVGKRGITVAGPVPMEWDG